MNIAYIIALGILLVIYRVGYKFISNLSAANSMFIMGLIIVVCSMVMGGLYKPQTITRKDLIGVLMISLSTFFVDYGYVKLTQLGYSSSILNIATTIIGLAGAVLLFVLFFNDSISTKQYIGIGLGVISLFLILYK